MAWLHARPRKPPPKRKRNERHPHEDETPPTRQERLQAEDAMPALPDPGPAAYLAGILFDVGPLQAGAMSFVPLDYVQINAWAAGHAQPLSPWESETLRALSRAYHHELARAEDPAAAMPGSAHESPEQAAERRERVSKGLGVALRAMVRTMRQS